MGPRDSPPSELGGSGNGARADVARKAKEVERMLAKLEEAGVEIDDKIASIIDDEVARIRAEAEREKNIDALKDNGLLLGGSGNGARAEVEHMLANLLEEGVEIDGKIASILDDEIARIKAEAEREKNINGLKINGCVILYTISVIAIGFVLGADFVEQSLPALVAKAIIFGDRIP
ncbi:uncharacterized protein LOC124663559 [Lolium rigidum]|uniref:uncharacterized protein LOC124663559 n=1 Tax=Lolium rigidum TaxID=89674 RepID=UPI001F5D7C14|nr:uncharacterized protein LOC124663559 [Lolium rigidum]